MATTKATPTTPTAVCVGGGEDSGPKNARGLSFPAVSSPLLCEPCTDGEQEDEEGVWECDAVVNETPPSSPLRDNTSSSSASQVRFQQAQQEKTHPPRRRFFVSSRGRRWWPFFLGRRGVGGVCAPQVATSPPPPPPPPPPPLPPPLPSSVAGEGTSLPPILSNSEFWGVIPEPHRSKSIATEDSDLSSFGDDLGGSRSEAWSWTSDAYSEQPDGQGAPLASLVTMPCDLLGPNSPISAMKGVGDLDIAWLDERGVRTVGQLASGPCDLAERMQEWVDRAQLLLALADHGTPTPTEEIGDLCVTVDAEERHAG